HRPGLGLSAAYGLQLDIRAETQRGEKTHGFFQGGHALVREGGAEPSSRIVTSYRREGERAQLSAPVCRALQPTVMKQDGLRVGGEADIELDPPAIERPCSAKAGERVFGRARGGTAMAD